MSKSELQHITADDDGIRLDRWFKRHWPGITHGRLEKLLRTGQVRVDGKRVKASDRLEAGQNLRLPPEHVLKDACSREEKPASKPALISPDEERRLQDAVLYEDDDLIVLNKPSGLAAQGGTNMAISLDDLTHVLARPGEGKPKLVHRLDKDTSGIIVLARTAATATFLMHTFQQRQVRKIYWAVVAGNPSQAQGEIIAPLLKKGRGSVEKMYVDKQGDKAETFFCLKEKGGKLIAWLEMEPKTGRTHQLRAHAAYIGTPIIGDGKYGGRDAYPLGRPCTLHLHARAIYLPTRSGKTLNLSAPLPPHMRETFQKFGWQED